MAKLGRYKLGVWVAIVLQLSLCGGVWSQQTVKVSYRLVDKDSAVKAKLKLKTSFPSAMQASEYLLQLPNLLQARGYISASVDSIQQQEDQLTAHLFLGEEYKLANIKVPAEYKTYIEEVGQGNRSLAGTSFTQYQTLQEKLLDFFENTGYPFAQVRLDSIEINKDELNAILFIDRGIPYKIDSIRLFGPAKISRNFVHRYLNIERGSSYSQQKLAKINQRLLELPYLQQAQPWDVSMLNTGSTVNLYLQPKKSNQVNVLAGFLPDNRQLGGKLLFTVDANLQLKNAFGTGENIGMVWQQIQPRSPRLNLVYQQPYIFNSMFGVDFSFDLFKKDSTFLNLNAQLGLRYNLSALQSARLSIQNQRTNVLQIDTFQVKNRRQLPDIADVSSVNLAVDYELNNTNYRFNPVRGNELTIGLSVGNKKIRKNNAIVQLKDPFFDYNTLYDTIKLNTYQVRFKAIFAHYFALGRQSVVKAGVNTGIYESPTGFRNELFQIGGYKLLRGFDEESIYANRYAVATIEYRYLLGLNSYFFGFTDYGHTQFKNVVSSISSQLLGAGFGLAFETKGGIFNVSYAAGKRNDVPFNIKESKIHFGYVSTF